jgi:hypothetical protein
LDGRKSIEAFINNFPWETTGEKIWNCIQIFGLENAPIRSMDVEWKYKNMCLVMIGEERGPDNHAPIVLARDANNPNDATIWNAFWEYPAIVTEYLPGWYQLHWFPTHMESII